jgi:serine/threonine-protein kinase
MDWTLSSTNQLARQLQKLGLLPRPRARRYLKDAAHHDDPRIFLSGLVEQHALTSYQAEQILAGRARRLIVGPYVLRERVARGGMGHVYKAEHRLMKRVVALKLVGRVRPGRKHAGVRRRFRREVEAAGRVRHPGIVTAFDAGEADGQLYLAMEFIEGVDLGCLVRDTGPLPVPLTCQLIKQTAEALHHAHQCGLLHRDIKPSNLMLAPPGLHVKLLDLGLACLRDRHRDGSDGPLKEVEFGGTPDYMAPEWWDDHSRVDDRADLYSLGCTFYYLLTGEVPFPGGSWTEKVLRHTLDEPIPLQQLRPLVPAPVAAIVERLMAREREKRPATAADVAAELAALGERSPLSASGDRPPAPSEARKPRPRLVRFTLAAVLVVLLGVLAAGAARRMVPTPSETPLPPEETTKIAAPSTPPSFSIQGRSDRYPSLAQAIAAAREGDVLLIRGPGPFTTPSLDCAAKSLAIKAEGGTRPRLLLNAGDDPWRALFHAGGTLTLEGLDLAVAAASSAPSSVPLVRSENASLRLRDCRLTGASEGPALIVRNPEELHLERCRIDAGLVGISLEIGRLGSCRLRVIDSEIHVRHTSGVALSLWAPEVCHPTSVQLALEGNTIQAARIAASRSLPARLSITARRNRFQYRSALLSYSGYADRDAWRRNTNWQGSGNAYDGPASWLSVEGRPVPLSELGDPRSSLPTASTRSGD